MKKLILVLAVLSMTGCTSYGALQVACERGDVNACVTKANRDNVLGGMAYSMQQQQQYMQPQASPNADVVEQLQRMQAHQDFQNFQRQSMDNFNRFNDNM